MRASTNIRLREKKTLVLNDFKGADFSSSRYDVSTKRASEMRNLINENGINRKRRGWREIKRFYTEAGDTKKYLNINGIFEYRHDEHNVILVHAGDRFFRFSREDVALHEQNEKYEDITDGLSLTNTKSQAFYDKGRLYIVGVGKYLAYGTWDGGKTYKLKEVFGAADTYIPTTSTSINHDGEADSIRLTLEKVNLLTPWRKNQLLGTKDPEQEIGGGTAEDTEGGEEESNTHTWTLDSGYIDAGTEVKIKLETFDESRNVVTYEIVNGETDKSTLYRASEAVGSVDFEKGKITLSIPVTTPVNGTDNIFVTFSATVEGYENRINKCSFGTLFGAEGNTDRLFLSGNSDFPNVDFYSEPEDYTYFPDENNCTVGSSASAINGYMRLSDSTLIVFKEVYMNEPCVFYRTGTTRIEYDSYGIISSVYGIFPSVAGLVGESLVSRHALANLGGDCLMLSENGVYGVVLGSNVSTTERYTRERSRTINERLKKQNLKDAVGVVYKNKYYLAVDGVCYVADARFTFRTGDALDNAYNYEWWYFDNIPACVFFILDGNLYFGTASGEICVFDEEYADRTYFLAEEGDLLLNNASSPSSEITFNENLGITDDDRIKFSDDIYICVLEDAKVKDGLICVPITNEEDDSISDSEVILDTLFNEMKVYVKTTGEELDASLSENQEYEICEFDRGRVTFKLGIRDENGEVKPVEIKSGGFSIFRNVGHKELYVTNVKKDEKTSTFEVKEYTNGAPLILSQYSDEDNTSPTAIITLRRPVVAEWYSPIMDMGTNAWSKTLLKLTVSTEPEVNGNITFGFETRAASKTMNAKGISVFSFEDFSFENFSFDAGFATSYSVRVNERNFNYIIFRFVSESDTDCAVNNITVLYKINKSNRGVR